MNDTTAPTQSEYMLTEYFASDGFYFRGPSEEEGHTKACLANAMIAAIQNFRDESSYSDVDFVLWAQDRGPLEVGLGYLRDDLSDCQCPQKVVEEKHYLTLKYYSANLDRWVAEEFYETLTGVAAQAADYVALGVAARAEVVLNDWTITDGSEVPALWMSLPEQPV